MCFNVIEGHSSVVGDNDAEGDRTICAQGQQQEESEIAYENIIEHMIEEQSLRLEEGDTSTVVADSNLTLPEPPRGQVLAEIVDQSSVLQEIDHNSSASLI